MEQEKMSEDEVVQWRDLLQKRKHSFMASEDNIQKQAFEGLSAEGTGEISRVRLHPGDLATNTQEVETLESLSEQNIRTIQEIDDALERLNKGTYGTCENCGESIPQKRLQIVPEARYCLECEQEIERMEKQFVPEKKNAQARYSLRLSEALGQFLVSDVMETNPVTVNSNESLETAASLLVQNSFRHLPVVDEAMNIQGIISDRDLLSVVLKLTPAKIMERVENFWGKTQVKGVMTKTPETVTPDTTLLEAGLALLDNKISSLPVVEGTRLVGIITESDFVKLVSGISSANA